MSNLTKKYIEKKYKVYLTKNNGFDDSRKYWECWDREFGGNYLCDGWTLKEIEEKLIARSDING